MRPGTESNSPATWVAWFQLMVGLLMAAVWPVLIATGEVPEIAEGQRAIWFHLAAESLTAGLLIAAGALILAGRVRQIAVPLSTLALGALLYTAVNSPGYYADQGHWFMVAIFAALTVATALAVVASLRRVQQPPGSPG
jgi:hypothetical protein